MTRFSCRSEELWGTQLVNDQCKKTLAPIVPSVPRWSPIQLLIFYIHLGKLYTFIDLVMSTWVHLNVKVFKTPKFDAVHVEVQERCKKNSTRPTHARTEIEVKGAFSKFCPIIAHLHFCGFQIKRYLSWVTTSSKYQLVLTFRL